MTTLGVVGQSCKTLGNLKEKGKREFSKVGKGKGSMPLAASGIACAWLTFSPVCLKPSDRSALDGSALDGSVSDGSASDGSALDGSALDGSALDGSAWNYCNAIVGLQVTK